MPVTARHSAPAHPPASAPDLMPVTADDRWGAVEDAAGGDLLARLVVGVRARAGDLVDLAVERITAAIPAYAAANAVDPDDLWWSVYRNLELNLLLLAEGRDVTPEELRSRAALGRRRAQAQVDVLDLLRAFRIGYLCLWEGLTERARELGPGAVDCLLESAARVWALLDRVCAAVEQGHRDHVARLDGETRRRSLALLAALRALPRARDDAERHARGLLLDPAGSFVGAIASGPAEHPPSLASSAVVDEPDRVLLLVQPRDPSTEVAELGNLLHRHGYDHVGLGVPRNGLAGAARSLEDAEQAHATALATRRSLVSYAEDWFECLVCGAADGLDALVPGLVSAVREVPQLAETLAALVAANGNLTAAAGALYLHPNTVAYRLRRLQDDTGVDARSPEGMLHTRLALVLAARRATG